MDNQSCFRQFLKYCSLNILGMVGLSCYILADTFFVSKGLGADGLTALNLAIPVYSFIHGSGLMLGIGGATKYSILKGRNESKSSDNLFTNTMYMAILLSSVFLLSGLFLSEKISTLLGADTTIFEMTNTYLKVILLFSPAFIINDILICFVRNDGNPNLSMLAMLLGSISNIVLDYIFIFPLHLGIFGAVSATGISPIISIAVLSVHKFKRQNTFHLKKSEIRLQSTIHIISLGFPSLITELSSGIVMIIFNTIILKISGNTGVAAYGVIANLSLVAVAIYTGLAQGMQPLVSNAHGRGDVSSIKQVFLYSVTFAFIISSIIYISVFLFSDSIALAFNSQNSAMLQEIATQGLKLYFPAVFFVGLNIVISTFFTSTAKPFPAHLISILRGFVLIIPAAFLLSSLFGITGVWLAFPVTEFAVSCLGIILYCVLYRSNLTKL